VLTLYRIGGYREESDDAVEIQLDGPSVVFHPAGAAHADQIGVTGLETLALTFDPAWLDAEARRFLPKRSRWLIGGAVFAASQPLARACLATGVSNAALRRAASVFFQMAFADDAKAPTREPAWARRAREAIEAPHISTNDLASALELHPAWLARAYRAWRGEGLAETARRLRVERAVLLLRQDASGLADVAVACGFCDQSHMNRSFHAVLGRTPAHVRGEAALLAAL
jgi:AraC family transcriptional regulator